MATMAFKEDDKYRGKTIFWNMTDRQLDANCFL